MTPAMSATGLAGIEGVADAGPATIAPEALQELCHPLFAIWAVHPGPPAAEVTASPGNPNPLHDIAAVKFQFQPIARADDPVQCRPAQTRLQGHAIVLQQAGSL